VRLKSPIILHQLWQCVVHAFPKGMKTSWWLLKITIPVSFGVMLLDYYGVLAFIAQYTGFIFNWFGLPGVTAIILVTSIFASVYAVVAILSVLHMPMREGIIIATMCLISHNFIVETAVMKRTGSNAIRMITVRLVASFVAAWLLNWLMPGLPSSGIDNLSIIHRQFSEMFSVWASSMASTTVKILILVNLLLIFQQIMEDFGWIIFLQRPLRPIMKLFGLPESTTISWVVANLIGLAYGSAIMIDQRDKNKMSAEDADLLNHHVAVSHSQLEDPLLFLALGYTIHWLIWPRIVIAIVFVWLRKAQMAFLNKK